MCKALLEFLGIKPGNAEIQMPIQYPPLVIPTVPFDITYTVKNTGNTNDVLYGHLMVAGQELAGSYWSENVAVDGTVTKTYTHPGITAATTIILEVGRV